LISLASLAQKTLTAKGAKMRRKECKEAVKNDAASASGV